MNQKDQIIWRTLSNENIIFADKGSYEVKVIGGEFYVLKVNTDEDTCINEIRQLLKDAEISAVFSEGIIDNTLS